MDPELRAGIVALLRRGHAVAAIADLLGCSQKTVAAVQWRESSEPKDGPVPVESRWSGGRRGQYDEDLNADIRMMLSEDRPTSVIAKECRVSEQFVRQIRQHDCPDRIGTRRVEETLLDDRPFRIGKPGGALRFEAIAACYDDCLVAGDGAVRRTIFELRQLALDRALPEPMHTLLVSTLQERDRRRLSNLELAERLEEIRARLEGRSAESPAEQRAS